MADVLSQSQFVREAPDIEAQKVALMQSAKAQVDATNAAALRGQYLNPDYNIASMSPDQLNAMDLGRQGIGAYQPFMNAAAKSVQTGAGTLGAAADLMAGADTRNQFGAAQAAMNQASMPIQNIGQAATVAQQGIGTLSGAAQMYNPANAQGFMNPYQQQVIDESMRQINRQGDITQQQMQAQAVRSGAFGGSRQGIESAELQRNLAAQKNAAITGALQQGYGAAQQQAQQAFEQQQQRQMAQAQGYQGAAGNLANIYGQQAGLGMQQAQGIGGLAAQQFGIGSQLASGLAGIGTAQGNIGAQQGALGQATQQLGQQDVNFLYNLGSQQQKQAQAELDAQRQNQLQQNMQPYQQIAYLSDIYKGAPSSQMSSMSQSAPTPSPFQQITGVGTGILSTAAAGRVAGVI